jgi:3'-phosphoadenosine 5'-phosphosulfate sulfotransferase (PAPS reductase)/FAD synthetase
MKNLLVSFSGGETSAFMAQWLNNHYQDYGYENIVFVYANTGLENEQTLEFIERCDKQFNLNVQWIESDVIFEEGKGTLYYHTNFENASRKGEPFEQVIKKYGIPNMATPFCTRELKSYPIAKFGKQWFNGEKYDTGIGIRRDEIDRINPNFRDKNFIYPLAMDNMIPTTKPMINFYWKNMPFRLELKSYQGNCATCWKKADAKLFQIYKENPKLFDFMIRMENEYGQYIPAARLNKRKKEGKIIPEQTTFFRNNRSALDIIEQAKNWNGIIRNDADQYNYQIDLLGGESCEIWSECSNE